MGSSQSNRDVDGAKDELEPDPFPQSNGSSMNIERRARQKPEMCLDVTRWAGKRDTDRGPLGQVHLSTPRSPMQYACEILPLPFATATCPSRDPSPLFEKSAGHWHSSRPRREVQMINV